LDPRLAAPKIFSYPQQRRPITPSFGGKADMTVCGNPLSRSLFGVKLKRTFLFASHMSVA
jgi:hypothetical protein